MRRSLAMIGALMAFLAAPCAHAEPLFDGSFKCAMGADVAAAVSALATGNAPITLTLGDNGFAFTGGLLNLRGTVRASGPTQDSTAIAASSGNIDANAVVFLDSLDAPNFALVVVGRLRDGKRGAILLPTKAKRAFACVDASGMILEKGSDAPKTGVPASAPASGNTIRPVKRVTKSEDKHLPMPTPRQRGKEASIMGALSKTVPDEGHYSCKTVRFFSDGTNKQKDSIGSHDDQSAFDLFSDGTYRMSGKPDSLGYGTFRAGPAAGSVIFDEGILSIYFDGAIHVRAKQGASLLYETDYDSDDALDEMIVCLRDGPAKTKSVAVENADKGRKNLAPPAHSGEAISGLYYNIAWIQMFGPDFAMYQNPSYTFRYFYPNGFVWIGDEPADGDFGRLSCSKPMIDAQGEALCTTYSLENGKLRIGNEAPLKVEKTEGGLSIDGSVFSFVPPNDGMTFNKSYRYFSYNGIAAFEGTIAFTSGGAFTSSSGVGIAYTTPEIGDTRTTVTGYDEKAPINGRYKLEGNSIIITRDNGEVIKRFFAVLSEGMLYMNGRAYLDRDN